MKPPLVVYHKDCSDGFCCAWLMRRVWPDAEFVAAQYGDPPPDATDRNVFILDFSYKRPVMMEMFHKAKSVVALDHHKTAQADLDGILDEYARQTEFKEGTQFPKVVFDMTKSGARLTLEHLASRFTGFSNPNWLVDYTEDRDLWRWKLPQSREVNAALRSYPFDFEVWDRFHGFRSPEGLALEGEAILRAEQQQVRLHAARAWEAEIAGHRVPVVNATVLMSEIGNELCRGKPFSATFFLRDDGMIVFSLRSDENGLDVSEIARRFGGGGHKHAAGFQTTQPVMTDL